jgi:hypothetical protein
MGYRTDTTDDIGQYHAYNKGTLNRLTGLFFLAMVICLSALLLAASPSSSLRLLPVCMGLISLFAAIRSQPLPLTIILGAWWGCCLYVFSFVCDNSVIPCSLTGACVSIVMPALCAALGKIFVLRYGYYPLALALGWVVFEFALTRLGTARSIPLSETGINPILCVIADFLGYGFIGFLVAYVNAALVSVAVDFCIDGDRASPFVFRDESFHLLTVNEVFSPIANAITALRPRAPPVRGP